MEQVEYQGEGELLKLLEEKKIVRRRIVDLSRKNEIPNTEKYRIVTSETVHFKDIIHRINDRFQQI